MGIQKDGGVLFHKVKDKYSINQQFKSKYASKSYTYINQ